MNSVHDQTELHKYSRIPKNDPICREQELKTYLFDVPSYYSDTLNVTAMLQNLRSLTVDDIECNPRVIKPLLLQLPHLESLQITFCDLLNREFAWKQYKKLITRRYDEKSNVVDPDVTDTTFNGDGANIDAISTLSNPSYQWDLANKDELQRAPKLKHLTVSHSWIAMDPYHRYNYLEPEMKDVCQFLEWIILLTRRHLETLEVSMINKNLSEDPFSSWMCRFGDKFDHSTKSDCIFPKMKRLSLTELDGRYSYFHSPILLPSIIDLLKECSAGTLKELNFSLVHNPTQLLCEMVNMSHLRDHLEQLSITMEINPRMFVDADHDNSLNLLKNVINRFLNTSGDEHRFKKLNILDFEEIGISHNPRWRETFKRKWNNDIVRLLGCTMIGPSLKELNVFGYDPMLATSLWQWRQSIEFIRIVSPFDTTLIDAIAEAGCPNLAHFIVGHRLSDFTPHFDLSTPFSTIFLEKCSHVPFDSIKRLIVSCPQLQELRLRGTFIIRNEVELVIDSRAMIPGGLVRAYAEACAQLPKVKDKEGKMKQHPAIVADGINEHGKEETIRKIVFLETNSSDFEQLTVDELMMIRPYFVHVKKLQLIGPITHNTIIKVHTVMPNIEVISSDPKWYHEIDGFTIRFAAREFPHLKSFDLPRTWSRNYAYGDEQRQATIGRLEEREISHWKKLLSDSLASGEPILQHRGIEHVNVDCVSAYPIALYYLFAYAMDTRLLLYKDSVQEYECKKINYLVRRLYDAKYDNKCSKMKKFARQTLKKRYTWMVEKMVQLRILRELIHFEPEVEGRRQEWIDELEKDVKDCSEWVSNRDIISEIADQVLALKTAVLVKDIEDYDYRDEGNMYGRLHVFEGDTTLEDYYNRDSDEEEL